MDIYTYFTAEQMQTLIGKARKGTPTLFKHLQENYTNDYQELIYAFADCMPELVAEDRRYKSGPRKGQRKLMFRNLDVGVDRIVAQELTNTNGWKEFYEVNQYCKKSMTEVVLTPPENSIAYSKHWIRAFLTRPDFSTVKEHYRAMTVPHIACTQQLVDQWIADNNADIEEIMTWTGAKYNQWHFANMKEAAECS
jgi:hypothetical protein